MFHYYALLNHIGSSKRYTVFCDVIIVPLCNNNAFAIMCWNAFNRHHFLVNKFHVDIIWPMFFKVMADLFKEIGYMFLQWNISEMFIICNCVL